MQLPNSSIMASLGNTNLDVEIGVVVCIHPVDDSLKHFRDKLHLCPSVMNSIRDQIRLLKPQIPMNPFFSVFFLI